MNYYPVDSKKATKPSKIVRAVYQSRLPREFYRRNTLTVARELIGKIIVLRRNGVTLSGRITETEAYIGEDDPACHARFGKTGRNAVMYGDAGYTYIYFIYGMHNLLNFVTERRGFPAAVLIRALEPLEGIEVMQEHRGISEIRQLTTGPGKLCQALGLTTADSAQSLTSSGLFVCDDGYRARRVLSTRRIGINEGRDRLWRFIESDNSFVSK